VELLVCGTSDTTKGRETEQAAQVAALALGIPTVVIEDFPGNFTPVRNRRPRLLCVESEFAAWLARRGLPELQIHVGPAIRYDALRRNLRALRNGTSFSPAVLWIGQPETAHALQTLRRLLPPLAARKVPVWFRAHPRDAGHAGGAYADLPLDDLTRLPLEDCLARRPRLIITQFSSVAIEAGFWGIPALNVLFPDAGGQLLAAKNGYSVPPWCEEGAAFHVVDPAGVDEVLDRALGSLQARADVMGAFERYFDVHRQGGPILINLLYNQGLL
jgi:hypothetical protein